MFENSRRGRQARNFAKNVPKILDLKSSSEQIFSENCRWVPLKPKWQAPVSFFGLVQVRAYARARIRNFSLGSKKPKPATQA